MTKASSDLSTKATYAVAHTAQCKLNLSSAHPDRNLRFVLGHTFLFEKALLRVAEIEDSLDAENEAEQDDHQNPDQSNVDSAEDTAEREGHSGSLAGGTVTFKEDTSDPSYHHHHHQHRPPSPEAEYDVVDDDEDEDEDDGFGLQRFGSASAQPPRLIASSEDDSDEEEDDSGPISPPSLPSDLDVRGVIEGQEAEDLESLYESLSHCPCHGEKCDKSKRIWEIKDPRYGAGGGGGVKSNKRLAIMQVDA